MTKEELELVDEDYFSLNAKDELKILEKQLELSKLKTRQIKSKIKEIKNKLEKGEYDEEE